MPRLITKFKYIKPGNGDRSAGGYARYIATREGVEKLDDTKRHAPVTLKQQEMILRLLTDFPDARASHEYQDYRREKTIGNASELISRILDENMEQLAGSKTYADYIATRPRAERFSSHGLFTDDGVQVQLNKVSEELNSYPGHIYTIILSLRREDAVRLGFDNGSRWRDFLRSQTSTLSENLKIPMEHLRWFAAFHDEGHHPHVHMIAYSSVPGEGHLSKQGVEKIRSVLARDIFAQDLLHVYQKQTEYRDQLREQGRESVAEIVEQINSGVYANSRVEQLLVSLSDRLSRTSGKKVYGYLKSDVKAIVDEIVAELASDERIRKLYDLWYQRREEVLGTYTDYFPDRLPLEQNPDFKPIRNAVIQETMKIVSGIRHAAEQEPQQDLWEAGLPTGEENQADPAFWMERIPNQQFQPKAPEVPMEDVDDEPEESPVFRSTSCREWWSDYYKLARRYLNGTKEQKPDGKKALPLLLMEGNRGNGYASYDIGRMYLLGLGCEPDEEEAQRWFRDALEFFLKVEQTPDASSYLRYRIGKCYAQGHGTERDYAEAARWFRQAVEENSPFAAYALGGQYLRGQGVEQSDTEAYDLFYKAAVHPKQPSPYAQYQLGKMCRDGIGTPQDLEASQSWFRQAYAGFLKMASTMDDGGLYYRLGSMTMDGIGTEADLEQARIYFVKAVELGNADALYGLGKLYLKQAFSGCDPVKAAAYLEQAVAENHAFAKYQLGKLLCQGELIPKDASRGLELLEELAAEGVTFAAYHAGKVYLKEESLRDVKKAIHYLQMAAEDGNSYAEYQLGKLYYFGKGVRPDQEKGLAYLKESAAHGNEYAANLLQEIHRQHTWGAASCAASLMAQLGRLFQAQEEQRQAQQIRTDRKHRREIQEKKQALGIRD